MDRKILLTEEMLPQIREMISPCVLSKSQLEEYPPCPHRAIPGTDLVACVQIIRDNRSAIGTDSLMHALHMTQKEILDLAVQNQREHAYTLTPLTSMIGSMTGMEMEKAQIPVLLLSNRGMMMGAGEILNREAMEEAAKVLGDDIIILPSSKHEVLLVSARDADIPVLEEMVRSINDTVVSDADKLSDSVYSYDSLAHSFSMPSQTEAMSESSSMSSHVEGGLRI